MYSLYLVKNFVTDEDDEEEEEEEILNLDNLASYFAQPLLCVPKRASSSPYSKTKRSSSPLADNSNQFVCSECGRAYKLKSSLRNHQKWECGKEPQFKCQYCPYKAKQKMHITRHIERMHKNIDYTAIKSEINKMEIKGEPSTILSRE